MSQSFATGVASGTTNITATLDGVTSPSVTLKVISLSSIAVKPVSPPNLAVGSDQLFTATGTYSDGSTADLSEDVTWSSDNTATATMNGYGFATGIAPGTANITASLSGITSPAVSLTVIVAASTTTSP
jgi:uncharacterized protein YjdB